MRNIISSIEGEFRKYKRLAELAIGQLSEQQFSESAPGANSVTALVWHVSGNLKSRFTEFLETDGEKPWRDKASEFQPRNVSRAELLARWNDGWAALFQSLEKLTDDQLAAFVKIRGEQLRVDQALHRALAHASYHAGQIIYQAKALQGASWKDLKTVGR